MLVNLKNSPRATWLEKSILIPIPKKVNDKEYSNYCIIVHISHARKLMFKILQARLQQYVNWELPDLQAGFWKGGWTRDQIANIRWIIEKAREFQKKHLLLLHWLCGSQQTGKFFKKWKYQTTYLPPEKPVCRSRSNGIRVRIRDGTKDWFKLGK